MSDERLVVDDGDFWTDPRRREDELVPRLLEEGFLGLRLDAPGRLDVEEVDALPLVGLFGGTAQERQVHDLERDLVVVATRVESRQTWAALLHEPRRAPRGRPRSVAPAGSGRGMRMFAADARPRLPDLPWRPGTLALRLLLADKASNPVRTVLGRGARPIEQDPAVQAFLAEHRQPAFPRPVWPLPDSPLPTFDPVDGSPEPPAEVGIVVALDRVNVVREGGPQVTCIARGSFRLPLSPRDLVRPEPLREADDDDAPGAAAAGADDALPDWDPRVEREAERAERRAAEDEGLGLVWRDVGDPAARAVIPVTLVGTGAKRPDPLVVPLQVPIYADLDPARLPPTVTGHFALDLLRVPDGYKLLRQTTHLWAFSGDVVAGPFTTAVVAEAEVRRP